MSNFTVADIALLAGHPTDSAFLRQITSYTLNINATLLEAIATGGIDLAGAFQGDTATTSQVTATDSAFLKLNSGLMLARGACVDATGDAAWSNVAPLNDFSNCGGLLTTAVHGALQNKKAFIAPTSISSTGSAAVEFSYDIHWLSVNSTALLEDGPFRPPFTTLSGQALTPSSLGESSQLYAIRVNGARLPRVTGFTYTPGFTIDRTPINGGAFSTEVMVTQRRATLEVQTSDRQGLLAYLNSQALGTGVSLELGRKEDGKQMRPITDAVHTIITSTAGIAQMQSPTASTGQKGSGSILLSLTQPAGGDPVTVATNIQLPA